MHFLENYTIVPSMYINAYFIYNFLEYASCTLGNSEMGNPLIGFSKNSLRSPVKAQCLEQSLLIVRFGCYFLLVPWLTRLLLGLTQRVKTLARHVSPSLGISH